MEAAAELPVDRQVEAVELAGEIAVELTALLVERRRRLQDPRRDPCREIDEQHLGVLARQADADEAAWRAGQEQRPERRIDGRVGDVEQALGGGDLGDSRGPPVALGSPLRLRSGFARLVVFVFVVMPAPFAIV